jgi:hypothetical protein
MKRYLLYIILFLLSLNIFSQIHLKDGAKIRINGGTVGSPIFVVLNSPPATPIATTSTGNGIIMEDEYNRLQYNLGSATTAITVPYMSLAQEEIPLTLTPTTAGSGAGNIRFSAKVAATRSSGFDNLVYKPSDVTNMAALPGISNNSNKTIDRFWIIDANNYTTKPAVTLSFTYIDAEWETNGGNSITESELKAQRFNNTSINDWEGTTAFPPAGTINTSSNTVSGVTVTSANFYKSWTLNASSVPLPIELKEFNAVCKNDFVFINWSTISETNNDFFTLEKSHDGINYIEIAQIDGNGTSTQINTYSFQDEKSQSTVYYRLKQTDFNGAVESFVPVALNCSSNENLISIQPNPNGGQFTLHGLKENNLIIISDLLGKIIYQAKATTEKMEVQLNEFSFGMYNVQVIDNDQSFVKKLIIE